MNATEKKGILLMAVCSFLWSIAGICIKLLPWNSLVIASGRSFIAAIVLGIFLVSTKSRLVLTKTSIMAGIFLGCTTTLFVTANKLTTAANAIVLQSANPVFIILISAIFFHQRFRRMDIAVVGLVLFGIGMFFFDDLSPGNMAGNLLSILSAATMACMYIFTTKSPSQNESMTGVMIGHIITTLVGLPFFFLYPPEINTSSVSLILILGVFQLGIPYVLLGLASRYCSALTCSLIGMIEPIMNPVLVFIGVGERPGWLALAGGTLVIVTISYWCYSNAKNSAKLAQAAELRAQELEENREGRFPEDPPPTPPAAV